MEPQGRDGHVRHRSRGSASRHCRSSTTLLGLVVISFLIEVLTLLWGPAKDATVPNIVKDPRPARVGELPVARRRVRHLSRSAPSCSRASPASRSGSAASTHSDRFGFDDKESLAIWVDSLTFLVSAVLISGLVLPRTKPRTRSAGRCDADVPRGRRRACSSSDPQPLVRGVMIGLAGGLIGGGSVVPLGPVLADSVLGGGERRVRTAHDRARHRRRDRCRVRSSLLQRKRRLPYEHVFTTTLIATGVSIIATAIGVDPDSGDVAHCRGRRDRRLPRTSPVSRCCRRPSRTRLRGRTFATLYTIVRLALLVSLTIGPFVASGSARSPRPGRRRRRDRRLHDLVARASVSHSGSAGSITVLSGIAARRRMRKAHDVEVADP